MQDETSPIISTHLLPDERLLWAGRPKRGFLLRAEDIWLIPFSLVWSFIPISGLVSAISSGEGQMGIVNVLFLTMGFYLLIGRFLVDIWLRSRTYYGLTNERALIVNGLISSEARSINLKTLSDLKLTQRGSGNGTIELGKPKFSFFGARSTRAMPLPGTGQYVTPAFEMITDVRRVYDLIIQAQHQAQHNP